MMNNFPRQTKVDRFRYLLRLFVYKRGMFDSIYADYSWLKGYPEFILNKKEFLWFIQ